MDRGQCLAVRKGLVLWMLVSGWLLIAIATVRAEPKATPAAPAANRPVDLGAAMTETMKMEFRPDMIAMAIWMPPEFLVEAGIADARAKGVQVSREQAEAEVGFVRDYLIVIVAAQRVADDGAFTDESAESLRARTVVVLPDGTKAQAIERPPPKVAAVAAAMASGMAAQTGRDNMHLLIFPNKGADGARAVNALKQQKLTVTLEANDKMPDVTFTWRTPFDAFVPGTPCARCEELVSAKWNFCPYCGQAAPKR